jgi:hypothetical protein
MRSEEIHDLYCSKCWLGDQMKEVEVGGACSTYVKDRITLHT